MIHNRFFRTIFVKFLGKSQISWKLITPLLKVVRTMSRDCVFCKIVKGEISSRKVYEDEDILAFYDINPQAPVHILVIPKKHIENILGISEGDKDLVFKLIKTCNNIAHQVGIAEKGFRLVVNTNPEGGQTVYHLHFHIIGGRQMRWPPG
ncbi:Purine nucleoside phosphoramidase [bacterium HR19]|mgnify:CR=1 FL=1|nr:Purine nucleoside phosphoramidase [bacterium HR19]